MTSEADKNSVCSPHNVASSILAHQEQSDFDSTSLTSQPSTVEQKSDAVNKRLSLQKSPEDNWTIAGGEVNCRVTRKRGVTDLQQIDFTYCWEIKNFRHCLLRNLVLFNSPRFTADDNDNIQWQLCMYPGGCDVNGEDYFSLYLCLANKEFKAVNKPVRITITLLDSLDAECIVHDILLSRIELHQQERTIKKFVKKAALLDDEKGYIGECGRLTIVCRMYFGAEMYSYLKPTNEKCFDPDEAEYAKYSLTKGFVTLFDSGKFSDAKIRVGDKDFNVHKNILSARSRVFSSMLEPTEDDDNRVILIDDVELEVLRQILRFIYGGKIKGMKNFKSDFLAAAHKYEINGLKEACEDELIDNLSVLNIGEMLVLADCYNTKSLKAVVIEFLSQHAQSVIHLPTFKNMLKMLSAPMLAEVVTTLMVKEL